MFAQIFLGIWMIIVGTSHICKRKYFVRKSLRNALTEEELALYQRGLIFPHMLLGATFIVMGIIEKREIVPMPVFLGIYILSGAMAITMIIRNNKKHL